MATLKDHMLVEIATTLCERARPDVRMVFIDALPSIEAFIFSGKGPFYAFRQFFMDNVIVTFVSSNMVRMAYRDFRWQLTSALLNTLFTKWARKVNMEAFEWLYASPRTGYSKMLAENCDMEELCIANHRFNDWATILKAFPKLITLQISGLNFPSMLSIASTELTFLKEVTFGGCSTENGFLDAHEALSNHQAKCPNLETVEYVTLSLKHIKFPETVASISSIKHLLIDTRVQCCTPLDFSFLTSAQKMFPNLESVDIDSDVHCRCDVRYQNPRKLEFVKSFYEAFESLSFGFFIKVTYSERFSCYQKDLDALRQFFATKGKIDGRPKKFTVETSDPRKRLTYEVDVTIEPDPADYPPYDSEAEAEEAEDRKRLDDHDFYYKYGRMKDDDDEEEHHSYEEDSDDE